ncbi:MAG: universal stress protein [Planctomycetota bacterium]|nr:universal stress protein [Planctomycetota bacterium]
MKVLFATDGSESAEQSIRWFSRMPIAHNATCEVITVATTPAFGVMPDDVYEGLMRLARTRASEWFQRAVAILKEANIDAAEVVRMGQSADEITRYAKESQSDLVVMGAQGGSQLTRLLIGSTTEAVVNHTPCSVLVVRNTTKLPPENPVVAIATDGSGIEGQIVMAIESLGLPKQSKLQLLSVVEDLFLLAPDSESGAYVARATSEALGRLEVRLDGVSSNIEKVVLEGAHVGDSLSEYLTSHPVDLVVLGDKGRSAIVHFFLGSVSRYVLHHAPCSVLIAKKKSK